MPGGGVELDGLGPTNHVWRWSNVIQICSQEFVHKGILSMSLDGPSLHMAHANWISRFRIGRTVYDQEGWLLSTYLWKKITCIQALHCCDYLSMDTNLYCTSFKNFHHSWLFPFWILFKKQWKYDDFSLRIFGIDT